LERSVEKEHGIQETAREARQGAIGHNVRYVLIVSCALAVVLLGAVFLFVGNHTG
jgi:hypothetical protein